MLALRYTAHSEIGLVRKNNQDSGYASPTMIVVADGMGGAAAGDLASAVAVDELRKADQGTHTGAAMLDAMTEAMNTANEHLAALVHDDHSLDGMGTTVCGAMFDGTYFGMAHLGDSRGYLWRDGELTRLTKDHSWVQSLVDEGKITEEQALYHPHRSLLLKVLNGQLGNPPDLELVEAKFGDRILFCSDGLCGLVDDEVIEDILLQDLTLDGTLDDLVAAAHAGGGLDNITIVIADVIEDAPGNTRPLVLGAAAEVSIPDIKPIPIMPEGPLSQRARNQVSKPGAPILFEDPEDARYRPIARTRKRRLWWMAVCLVLILAITGGIYAGQKVIENRFYIGESAGAVAIYQGIPAGIGPVQLSHLYESTPTQMSNLPDSQVGAVRDHLYRDLSLSMARVTAGQLQLKADECAAARRARSQNPPSSNPSAPSSAQPSAPAASTEGC